MISLTNFPEFPENVFTIQSKNHEERFLGLRVDDPERKEVVFFVGDHTFNADEALNLMIETGVALNQSTLVDLSQFLLATAIAMTPSNNDDHYLNGSEE